MNKAFLKELKKLENNLRNLKRSNHSKPKLGRPRKYLSLVEVLNNHYEQKIKYYNSSKKYAYNGGQRWKNNDINLLKKTLFINNYKHRGYKSDKTLSKQIGRTIMAIHTRRTLLRKETW